MATTSLPRPHRWRSPRRSVILGAALLVVAGSYVAATIVARHAPAKPASTATLQQVQTPDGPPPVVTQSLERVDQAIRVWSGNLARDSQDFVSATNLADLYALPLVDWAGVEARLDLGFAQAPGTRTGFGQESQVEWHAHLRTQLLEGVQRRPKASHSGLRIAAHRRGPSRQDLGHREVVGEPVFAADGSRLFGTVQRVTRILAKYL